MFGLWMAKYIGKLVFWEIWICKCEIILHLVNFVSLKTILHHYFVKILNKNYFSWYHIKPISIKTCFILYSIKGKLRQNLVVTNLTVLATCTGVVSYIHGLMQERHNSSVLAMELCISYINPSIWTTCWWWDLELEQILLMIWSVV